MIELAAILIAPLMILALMAVVVGSATSGMIDRGDDEWSDYDGEG